MFAIQRENGDFFCYTDKGVMGGFLHPSKCVNLWIKVYPSHINKHRNRLRRSYTGHKIKTVKLTPKQMEEFTFVKLRGPVNY